MIQWYNEIKREMNKLLKKLKKLNKLKTVDFKERPQEATCDINTDDLCLYFIYVYYPKILL